MSDDDTPATGRWQHAARLAACVAVLLGMFYLVAVARVIDIESVRSMVAATGPAAPLVYVAVSAALGAALVPGPILAAGSGLMFGPLVGTFVTLGATVGTAVVAAFLGARAGRDSTRGLLGTERTQRIDAGIERYGLWAVVGQRFVPGIPDTMASYVFGACGVPLWQMAVGSFIGSAPRAFVYTALGASIGEMSAPLAYTAITVWCVTAVAGAFAAHRGYRGLRRETRDTDSTRPTSPTDDPSAPSTA
ncbi:TVP38/TMEM64 family protein [Nocardia bovistercoris]|uniref:TVP38/TMEM64 family membrane protein n=1 Tax=Nocardia bovistercoris TaxID=2785916 RepID=A0A931ICD9_9NOCA|nr:TVP38/TMEM64 family protein [Nocardia bovistercoris]MBH0777961.1 TVP38/TMEM64 family protein [Nocardia bovistercoris]